MILKLAALLTLDGSRFKAGLKEADAATARFAKGVQSKIAGAFGAGALLFAARSLVDLNSNIKDTADALDISSKAFQEQSYWLTQNGAKAEDLITVYRGLAKARAEALSGNDGKLAAFARVGISPDMLEANSIEDLFKQTVAQFQSTDFGADKIALVMELLGRGGTSILPALSTSLSDASDEAHKLGQVIEDETNAKLEQLGDLLDQIKGKSQNIGSEILLGLIRALDLGATAIDMALVRTGQLALDIADKVTGAWEFITSPVLGKLPDVRGWLQENSALLADTGNDLFESMLDRWEQKAGGKGRKKGLPGFDEEDGKAAERELTKLERLRERLFDLDLKSMSAADQRLTLEEKIAEVIARQNQLRESGASESDILEQEVKIRELEQQLKGVKDDETPMSKEQQLRELLFKFTEAQLSGDTDLQRAFAEQGLDLANSLSKTSSLDVNSLTQQGQLGGGRNLIVTQENQFVAEAKKIFGETKRTAEAVTELNGKIKGSTTIRSSV